MDFLIEVQSLYSLDEQCFNISSRREILRRILKNISQGETLKGEELRDLFGSRDLATRSTPACGLLPSLCSKHLFSIENSMLKLNSHGYSTNWCTIHVISVKQIEVQSIEISETTKLCQLQMDTSHSFQLITYWI